MIDLYALTSPNVQKIFIALEELALPYNVKLVDVWKSEQYSEEFTKLNPNNKIPVIVDHQGPAGKPYTVIESGAILMYLASKTGKLLPADPIKRFDALQWLVLQVASLGPMCGQHAHFSRFAGQDVPYAQARYRTEVNRIFDVYEKRLSENAYVGGDEYTIADIAAFPWLRNIEFLNMSFDNRPHLKAWVAKLSERPAVKKALAAIGSIKNARDVATDDAKDRYFGRGKYAKA